MPLPMQTDRRPSDIYALLSKLKAVVKGAPLPRWEEMTDDQRRLSAVSSLIEAVERGLSIKDQYPSLGDSHTGFELAVSMADMLLSDIAKGHDVDMDRMERLMGAAR